MAISDEGGGVNVSMPVAPVGFAGYGGGGGFGGGFGGDWSWIIILFLFGMLGGWGNGNGGGFGFGGYGNDFAWLLNGQNNVSNNVSDGFRDAQLHDSVTSVRDGVSNLSTQLCGCCGDIQMSLANGFAGTTAAITGAQNAITQQLCNNEIASLNRSFAEQTANTAGFANVTMQNVGSTNMIVNAINTGIQSIKDDLCADRLDAERRENQNLRTQLSMAQLAASQIDQTAQIKAAQLAANTGLLTELRNCPIPAQAVYGNQPVFTCASQYNPNGWCGCGCNS